MVHRKITKHWILAIVAPHPRGVIKTMPNGNFLQCLLAITDRIVRSQDASWTKYLVCQLQLVLGNKGENSRGCYGFGHARNAKQVVRAHMLLPVFVREPVPFCEKKPPFMPH